MYYSCEISFRGITSICYLTERYSCELGCGGKSFKEKKNQTKSTPPPTPSPKPTRLNFPFALFALEEIPHISC